MPPSFAHERELLWRVLRAWTRDAELSPADARLESLINAVKRVTQWAFAGKIGKASLPLQVDELTDGVLVGPTVARDRPFRPIASLHLKEDDGHLNVCLRVITLYLDSANQPAADGYRFESGERTKGTPHPWCHMQRTTTWHKGTESLLIVFDGVGTTFAPAGEQYGRAAEEGHRDPAPSCNHFVNEFRPAVPLGCTTAAGLALAMIGSMHGVQLIHTILESDIKLSSELDPVDRAYLIPSHWTPNE
jgi:hypothetical protein